MKIFLDFEFTGLHQYTTPISLGIVSEQGHRFYAEFTDYDKSQVDDWLQMNVIANLQYTHKITAGNSGWETWPASQKDYANVLEFELDKDKNMSHFECIGEKPMIVNRLEKWIAQFKEPVQIWVDCGAYDWVLFCELFGHAFKIPASVYYIPFDISTLMILKGVNPDIRRELFAGIADSGYAKHNSLWDAGVIMKCYQKLIKMDCIYHPEEYSVQN